MVEAEYKTSDVVMMDLQTSMNSKSSLENEINTNLSPSSLSEFAIKPMSAFKIISFTVNSCEEGDSPIIHTNEDDEM